MSSSRTVSKTLVCPCKPCHTYKTNAAFRAHFNNFVHQAYEAGKQAAAEEIRQLRIQHGLELQRLHTKHTLEKDAILEKLVHVTQQLDQFTAILPDFLTGDLDDDTTSNVPLSVS